MGINKRVLGLYSRGTILERNSRLVKLNKYRNKYKNSTVRHTLLRPKKKICMFLVTRPTLILPPDPKRFFLFSKKTKLVRPFVPVFPFLIYLGLFLACFPSNFFYLFNNSHAFLYQIRNFYLWVQIKIK